MVLNHFNNHLTNIQSGIPCPNRNVSTEVGSVESRKKDNRVRYKVSLTVLCFFCVNPSRKSYKISGNNDSNLLRGKER